MDLFNPGRLGVVWLEFENPFSDFTRKRNLT